MNETSTLESLSRGSSRENTVPPPARRWISRLLIPLALLATLALLLVIAARESLSPTLDVEVVPVVAKTGGTVERGTTTVQAPGWVEADPYAVTVAALAPGVVRDVLVLEGEPVDAGQVVAVLVDDDADLALARAEARLRERESDVELIRATLTAAETNWANPYEHERAIAAAEAALASRQAELAKLDHELEVEAAVLRDLEDEATRLEKALDREAVSEARVVQTRLRREAQAARLAALRAEQPIREAAVRDAEATLAAAKRAYELRIQQTRDLDQSRAELARAEAQRDLARVERDEAALRLKRMQVRAPIAGTVMRRLVEPGTTLTSSPGGNGVVRIYDPDRLQVRVDVPLADAAKIGVDTPAEITVEVLPDRVFEGRVTRIVHEADIQKNTLEVKVAIDEPIAALKPEMLARVRFIAGSSTGADEIATGGAHRLFVPESLVVQSDGEACVWIVEQQGRRAVQRTITLTGRRSGEWVEVSGGLQPGDRVIATHLSDIEEGTRVRIVREARSPA